LGQCLGDLEKVRVLDWKVGFVCLNLPSTVLYMLALVLLHLFCPMYVVYTQSDPLLWLMYRLVPCLRTRYL